MGDVGDILGTGCLGLRLVLFVVFVLLAIAVVIVLAPLLLIVFLLIPFMFL